MLIRLTSFSLFTWTSVLLLPSLAFFVSRTTASHRLLHFTATSPHRQHHDVRYENPSPTTTFDYLSSITASLLAVYKDFVIEALRSICKVDYRYYSSIASRSNQLKSLTGAFLYCFLLLGFYLSCISISGFLVTVSLFVPCKKSPWNLADYLVLSVSAQEMKVVRLDLARNEGKLSFPRYRIGFQGFFHHFLYQLPIFADPWLRTNSENHMSWLVMDLKREDINILVGGLKPCNILSKMGSEAKVLSLEEVSKLVGLLFQERIFLFCGRVLISGVS
ncbi:hypothetical protein L2E82_17485 [Cichorium intybus]|uniref:Uncharacterized protein n=1 Tax=Cichorium intybus TaxID=13427 RepID=A0ACB9F8D5_CICIN|nr:hypothetical protein L2E82_17485 [Cichorium intybus]